MKTLSVIIPNYNHEVFLKQRIDSILQQRFIDFEIILLDDASEDNSVSIINHYRSHPKISHIIINSENSGSPFAQWQKGLASATGKWIWIAESDDIADPAFLETALEKLDQQPDASFFYADASYLAAENDPAPFQQYAAPKNRYFNTSRWSSDYAESGIGEINFCLKQACTVNNISSVVFRKSILEEAVQGTELFRFHGDWFCLLKAASRGNILYSGKTLNQFRMKTDSLLKGDDKLQSQQEYFMILQWLMEQEFVSDKKELLDYFVLNYCGYGLFADGPGYGKKLFRRYQSINQQLATQVKSRLFRLKWSRKKRNSLF